MPFSGIIMSLKKPWYDVGMLNNSRPSNTLTNFKLKS